MAIQGHASASSGGLGLDEVAESVDGGEGRHADFLFLDLDPELLLHPEDQLQRVDRVESQTVGALSEEGRRVLDRIGRDLELQLADDQFLDAGLQFSLFQSLLLVPLGTLSKV